VLTIISVCTTPTERRANWSGCPGEWRRQHEQ